MIGEHNSWRIKSADLAEALDEMLFASGKLNVKLLGGARETAQATVQG